MPTLAARRCGGVPHRALRVTAQLAVVCALVSAATASTARGQAWLPDKGSLGYTIGYADRTNKKHYLPSGDELDVGHTRTKILNVSVTYAFTNRLALSAGIPLVSAEYHGPRPHPGTHTDDSSYHTTFTDYRLDLRWQALTEPVAVAPFLSLTVPSHDYETLGHAAPGNGLMRYGAGFFAAKSLHRWIPRTYLHGRAGYTYLEPVAGVEHGRTNVDLEVGYFVTTRVAVRALGAWQEAHGGIEVPIPASHPLFRYHDQLGAESYLNVGAGGSWSVAEHVEIYAAYLTSLRGRNGHKLEDGFSLGVHYHVPCVFGRGACAAARRPHHG